MQTALQDSQHFEELTNLEKKGFNLGDQQSPDTELTPQKKSSCLPVPTLPKGKHNVREEYKPCYPLMDGLQDASCPKLFGAPPRGQETLCVLRGA